MHDGRYFFTFVRRLMYNNRVMEVALLQAETYQGNMYRVAMGGYEMDINGSCFFSGRHATKTNTTLKTCSPLSHLLQSVEKMYTLHGSL